MMHLPEDIRQKEVKCEKKGKNDPKTPKKCFFFAKIKRRSGRGSRKAEASATAKEKG